jgi:hypothetical protein
VLDLLLNVTEKYFLVFNEIVLDLCKSIETPTHSKTRLFSLVTVFQVFNHFDCCLGLYIVFQTAECFKYLVNLKIKVNNLPNFKPALICQKFSKGRSEPCLQVFAG